MFNLPSILTQSVGNHIIDAAVFPLHRIAKILQSVADRT